MKQKQADHHDLIVPMLALLLAIVVLLLITPSVCSCRWLGSGTPANNQVGGTTIDTTPIATSTTPITSSSTAPVQPSSFSLTPHSGPVGTVVIIHGSGFSADNAIEMNGLTGGAMKDIASPDGKMLTFTVPANLGPNCAPTQPCPQFLELVIPNSYTVSVITNGATQDVGTFTVTAQ